MQLKLFGMSVFSGELHKAVTPGVEGTAFITGKNKFVIDPNDNFKDGFILK